MYIYIYICIYIYKNTWNLLNSCGLSSREWPKLTSLPSPGHVAIIWNKEAYRLAKMAAEDNNDEDKLAVVKHHNLILNFLPPHIRSSLICFNPLCGSLFRSSPLQFLLLTKHTFFFFYNNQNNYMLLIICKHKFILVPLETICTILKHFVPIIIIEWYIHVYICLILIRFIMMSSYLFLLPSFILCTVPSSFHHYLLFSISKKNNIF
jgi:hypothetical protein